MALIARVAGLAALTAAAVVVRAPAWLVDAALDRATAGAVRLSAAEGTLWSGRGALIVIDPVTLRAQAWTSVAWRWQPMLLARGEAAWRLEADGRSAGEFAAGPAGWRADAVALSAPARFVMERVPHAFGRLGWRGDLQMETTQWHCSWAHRCEGRAALRWTRAASDVLRGRLLGDYQLEAQAQDGRIALQWQTLQGDTQITAQGSVTPSGPWSLQGDIRGDRALLQRLPAVAGRWVRQGATPGEFSFDLRGG